MTTEDDKGRARKDKLGRVMHVFSIKFFKNWGGFDLLIVKELRTGLRRVRFCLVVISRVSVSIVVWIMDSERIHGPQILRVGS